MREIKFRHWKTNTFIGPDFMDYEPELKYQEGKLGAIIANFAIDFDHLMQFTGLKDKNGVEIYEGDLVVQYYSEGLGDNKFKISKAAQGEEVIWCQSPTGHYLKNSFNHLTSFVEVVGNIYENPELLNKEEK